MKFQCSKSDILANIQQAQNIVGQKTTLQILSNLLIVASNNEVSFTSTDLEIGLYSTCKVDVIAEGKTTVPAKKFFDIIRTLPDKQIDIETDENNTTHVKCGKSSYSIYGLPAEDFPQLPSFADVDHWEFSQSILKRIIKQTNYSISKDESRYVLNGIYIVLNASEIIGVATDGRRLAFAKQTGMSFRDSKIDFILPSKTINELSKLLNDEGNLKVYHKGNQVCFNIGSTTLITKLIEGNFPEYQAVIPDNTLYKAIFDNDEFSAALNRMSILTTDKTNSIKLLFKENTCTISANSPSIGEAFEDMEIEYAGPELPIAFNPHYLIEILKCIDSKKVTIELINSLKPGLIKHDDKFLAVIMPMRLE
ncbi:MAG: DNA polymerase III subunit beta [uncultured bacterium]|nr:MAG: DNA polymerase III subunit beta [uncultured bacterium]